MGHFKFRWDGDQPVKLWGFGFQDDGSFRVRFETFSEFTQGVWTEIPVGYCGTGAEMFTLKPRQEYTLLIPLWPFQTKGEKGVVKIDGENVSLISTPFDTKSLREKRYRSRCIAGEASRPPHQGNPVDPVNPVKKKSLRVLAFPSTTLRVFDLREMECFRY
jgi:hypothetical protein